jgi:hypothetical protein
VVDVDLIEPSRLRHRNITILRFTVIMERFDIDRRLDGLAFAIALQRDRADFMEMSGLRLTRIQAQRLWSLDADICSAVLSRLVDVRFLSRSRSNTFSRARA